MANIPGAPNVLPDVFAEVVTNSRGASVPGGIRVAAIIGEGSRSETIVSSAVGAGLDGFNSTFTSTNGSDGRHFALSLFPIISNRTRLFRNGVPLVGLEAQIDSSSFSNRYDYRIDITNGRIELQKAHLVDQGGSFFVAAATNVGVGTISNLTLDDVNAPPETWTIKCVSVQRGPLNVPIANTAKFVAFGSVSGNKLDANGNPVLWVSNGQVVTNGILEFSINETTSGSTTISPFVEGDSFTIKVDSGVLVRNDTLTATYIAVGDLNDPTFFTDPDDVYNKHGQVTTENTLSLGAQLAFSNSPPGVMCLQAAPAVPRRVSYNLLDTVDASDTDVDEFVIALPINVTPDPDAQINFFVTNPATGVETQVLPNKFPYYTLGTSGQPTISDFVFDDVIAPAGNSFSYSVIKNTAALNFATDGYLNRSLTSSVLATFSSETVEFDSTYVGKKIKIFDTDFTSNDGEFDIIAVSGGNLSIQASGSPPFATFVNETSVTFDVINPVTGLSVADDVDGLLVAIPSTSTATFASNVMTGVDFNTIPALLGMKLQLSGTSNGNDGLYDITGYDDLTNTLTIAKSFVSEAGLKFEILDATAESDYIVINHNVVPNGYALRVSIVDTKDADFYDAGWITALDALELAECDIVVPLPTQTKSVIFQNTLTHCKTMSNIKNRKERVMFTGAIRGLTPDNVLGNKQAAVENIGVLEGIQGDTVSEILAGNTEDLTNYSVVDAFGNTFRCAYFYPDEIVVQVGADNVLLEGFYIAAAAAGYLSGSTNIAVPLTNKVLSGFTILKNKQYPQIVLENLAAAGLTVLRPVQGGGLVLWGKSTTQSGFPEEEELSIVFIRDRIAKSMRLGFRGFIGIAEDDDIIPTLSARAIGLLTSFVSQKLITNFADVSVKRDSVDPRQWNVSARVQPTYPVNWIYIKVNLGLI